MKPSEKFTVFASFATTALFSTYILTRRKKPKPVQAVGESIADKRKRLLQDPNVRILNNKMTFLYLQSYEGTAQSLFLLKDVLDLAQPQIIALQLSETDYNLEYSNVVRHPKFYEIMHKVDQLIASKDEVQLNTMPELDISKGIENLYLISYCNQIGCKILYADDPNSTYLTRFQQKLRLKEITNNGTTTLSAEQTFEFQDVDKKGLTLTETELKHQIFEQERTEKFVDKVMSELQPRINIIPDTPYKMIVGVVNKQNIEEVVDCWKSKFQASYGTQMTEDSYKINEDKIVNI